MTTTIPAEWKERYLKENLMNVAVSQTSSFVNGVIPGIERQHDDKIKELQSATREKTQQILEKQREASMLQSITQEGSLPEAGLLAKFGVFKPSSPEQPIKSNEKGMTPGKSGPGSRG